MAFPVFRHKDSPQVWMAFESDAKEVKTLTLMPIGPGPDINYAVYGRIFLRHLSLDTYHMPVPQRVQMVYHFKARLLFASQFRRISVFYYLGNIIQFHNLMRVKIKVKKHLKRNCLSLGLLNLSL